jgi:formate/nitrite transporter FocA (FNT family)
MSFAAHYVSSKIIVVVFPVAAFITLDFKHSATNMHLIPIAILLTGGTGITVSE